jgi:hypothetical protein
MILWLISNTTDEPMRMLDPLRNDPRFQKLAGSEASK